MKSEVIGKIVQYTKEYYKYSLKEDGFTIERYVDYRDEFPKEMIRNVLEADNPAAYLDEMVCEWNFGCEDWEYEEEFFKELKEFCKENRIDYDEAKGYVIENFYWDYPEDFLNPEFNAVIRIDTGDGNYDFSLHNVLNYWGEGRLNELSGLHWLAKQQGRLGLLNKEIKKAVNHSSGDCESPFVESSISELENLCTNLGRVTFLVKMHLNDALKILEKRKEHAKDFDEYHPLDTKGCPFGYITLSKNTTTGIFDGFNGSGSLMEIRLEKNVKIPIHLVYSIDTDEEIQKVYGLVGEGWDETLVKIA